MQREIIRVRVLREIVDCGIRSGDIFDALVSHGLAEIKLQTGVRVILAPPDFSRL